MGRRRHVARSHCDRDMRNYMTEKKMDRKNYFLKKIMNTITHKISKIFYRMCAIFLGSMIVSIL